jgi:hypothetical protein
MSKNLVLIIGLPFVVAGSVAAGVILGDIIVKQPETAIMPPEKVKPKEIKTEIDTTLQADPSLLILGKWKYTGSSKLAEKDVPKLFRHTIEYFEDGTYQENRDGVPPTIDPKTINGSYVVLSDGRLKRTFEDCDTLSCKEIVRVKSISFPDQNTYLEHYQYKEENRHEIYKREN